MLTKILSYLGLQSLRAARLVCRALRATSLPCIHSVTLVAQDGQWQRQLRLVSAFSSLKVQVDRVDAAAVVTDPLCKGKLHTLTINGSWLPTYHEDYDVNKDFNKLLGASRWAPFAAGIAEATRLSSLRLSNCSDMADSVLLACPRLEELHLIEDEQVEIMPCPGPVVAALRHVTNLTELQYRYVDGTSWAALLRALACLPKLVRLGRVNIEERDAADALVLLTQLANLSVMWYPSWEEARVQELSRLSRLSALELMDCGPFDGKNQGVKDILSHLRQLHHLSLLSWNSWESPFPIGGLTCLTYLQLSNGWLPDALGATLLHPGTSRLRSLDLIWGDTLEVECTGPATLNAIAALGPSLSNLEDLKLKVVRKRVWDAFLPQLSALTSLKSLDLKGPSLRRLQVGMEQMLAVMESASSLSPFSSLSRLTGLTWLSLENALEARHGPTDIPCLAQLTNLEVLSPVFPASGLSFGLMIGP